jgi:hypothetical protein
MKRKTKMAKKAMIAIHIDAGHTGNGNPRRGWIVFGKDGEFVAFVEEGYYGFSALKRAGFTGVPATERIGVTPSTYQQLKKGETV